MFWIKLIVRWAVSIAIMIGVFLLMRAHPTLAAVCVLLLIWYGNSLSDDVNRLQKTVQQKDDDIERLNARADKTRESLERQIDRLSHR